MAEISGKLACALRCPWSSFPMQGEGGLRSGSVKSNCEKLRKIAEKLRAPCGKTAAPQPHLPKPQGATLLHRGHTGHQQARKVDKQKVVAEKLLKLRENGGNCKIANNCEQLRTSTLPLPLPRVQGGQGGWMNTCARMTRRRRMRGPGAMPRSQHCSTCSFPSCSSPSIANSAPQATLICLRPGR